MKRELKVEYYIRYADDFVILHHNKSYLAHLRHGVDVFLKEKLKLQLHPDKVFIKTLASGVDFLGWIHFPHYRKIRTTTKRRVLRKLKGYPKPQTISSYRGLLSYGNTYKIQKSAGIVVA